MVIKLRQVGNSKTLTVPKNIKTHGEVYKVKNDGTSIVYTPVQRHVNIFATEDWKEYDYQKDIAKDSVLQSVKPIGREVID